MRDRLHRRDGGTRARMNPRPARGQAPFRAYGDLNLISRCMMSEDHSTTDLVTDELVEEAEADADPADAAEEPHEIVPPKPARPDGVPEKFWDPEAGTLRTDALLKSYLELERKLGSMVAMPAEDGDLLNNQRLRRLLGVPDSVEEYKIETSSELIEPDPVVNARLLEAGFNQHQAQLVYELAEDHVLPLLGDAMSELEASRDAERLATHFGGKDAWQNMARQIKTWAAANLPGEVTEVLASSYDGVLAMHQMMQAREPSVLRDAEAAGSGPSEAELTQMMRDPRYWRDHDPAFVAEVTKGFKRLYPS